MHCYDVLGLTIQAGLPVPGLEALSSPFCENQVQVDEGNVPASLEQAEKVRPLYEVSGDQVLVEVPGIGRLLITEGKRIVFERAPTGPDAPIFAHLLGTGLATIHHQRGNVVLHGGSLCRAGHAYLICGRSGAGKSTTLAHLLANGGETLGDDVTVVGDAPEFMIPAGPRVTKLADDVLVGLPDFQTMKTEMRCSKGKRVLPTEHLFAATPYPLSGVIVLEQRGVTQVSLERVPVSEAIALLWAHSFRKRFIARAKLPGLLIKWTALAHAVPVWRIARPAAHDTVAEVVAKAEDAIAKIADERRRRGSVG
ncbi:hypothetical protein [Sphingomonas sp.]|jgi:energy-coupling factor transporter ATP-binding protein EcfA2|uniref:hypothetical protein n=1 Tax=Sphingomonas sp. TaxID=28214 RepID=UPI002E0FBA10|nr:hypothetical protein [Sphingomonas sp.]